MVDCPICGKQVRELDINRHIDSQCESFIEAQSPQGNTQLHPFSGKAQVVSSFFQNSTTKSSGALGIEASKSSRSATGAGAAVCNRSSPSQAAGIKRPAEDGNPTDKLNGENVAASASAESSFESHNGVGLNGSKSTSLTPPVVKRPKTLSVSQQAAPLADRVRPRALDEICGQELVGPGGVLRGLIEQDRVPSMILWGGPGTGKTTIARVISNMVQSRFVEINSTSSGVGECKKLFAEARSEMALTGRKTIIFCDEIHRFSKSQQDVFLAPVESGQVTLVGATTENPSFKIQNALLSRCRTFVLDKLRETDVESILSRALEREAHNYASPLLVDSELIGYLAALSDGDARTALNLMELALGLSSQPGMTKEGIRRSLTKKQLLYDRSGDQHYDTISAFHKSIRGSDPDAALYYLARMIESGEDPLYVARRLIVVASEDIGLADNAMLPLAVAAYAAVERIGMPEAQINLAHATVAMALSKKSTRVYRSFKNVSAALQEPGTAGLPVPIHLRNAPTRLMREIGFGKEYKYNPNYKDGKVAQEVSGVVYLVRIHG